MLIGNTDNLPAWAPKPEDVVLLYAADFGGGRQELNPPIDFVPFIVDDAAPKGCIRLVGRRVQDMNDPDPGVGGLYVSQNDFEIVGHWEEKEID